LWALPEYAANRPANKRLKNTSEVDGHQRVCWYSPSSILEEMMRLLGVLKSVQNAHGLLFLLLVVVVVVAVVVVVVVVLLQI
jgi:hypothetical protein